MARYPSTPSFAMLLQRFFVDHLQQHRALSPRTISAYRDTFKLLLHFAEKFGALLWRVHSTGNLRCARGPLQTQEGWLDSHDRSPPGAIVPVEKSDFGCCGPLFGGEIAH